MKNEEKSECPKIGECLIKSVKVQSYNISCSKKGLMNIIVKSMIKFT